jgi:hypothetical protein
LFNATKRRKTPQSGRVEAGSIRQAYPPLTPPEKEIRPRLITTPDVGLKFEEAAHMSRVILPVGLKV